MLPVNWGHKKVEVAAARLALKATLPLHYFTSDLKASGITVVIEPGASPIHASKPSSCPLWSWGHPLQWPISCRMTIFKVKLPLLITSSGGSSGVLLICAKDLFVEGKQTAAATFRSLEPWRPYPPLVRYAEITA